MPDAPSWERVLETFSDVLEQPDHATREAYLQNLAGDAALLSEVRAMLRAHEASGLDIERRLLKNDDTPDLSGTLIGPYRLVRLVAMGGMSEVYAAEREGAPFRQMVALKLLRVGLASTDARLRFRQERQILARLVHPLIVPLLDGGVTDAGRPYLVLQFVDGEPITAFCDGQRCDLDRRLHLVIDVTRAVAHAHKSLVVHRDLKPSNVLVTGDGQVRLLDFGVAKLLDPAIEDDAPMTRAEVRIMTLEYAAPEQLAGGAVTTATDVYALGVLLYELASGRRPFVQDEAGRLALERRILESAPELPSRAAENGATRHWSRRLRGDLDTIILKAMAKEPDRRYASVADFAADLERFMAGRPITARRPSVAYRVSKFVGRNRVASAVSAISLVLLVGLMAAIAMQSQRVARQRDVAESERENADRVVALLVDLIATANPEQVPGGNDLTIGQFLQRADGTLQQQRNVDDVVQARLRHALGKVYMARSQFEQARASFEDAAARLRRQRGDTDPATAAVVHDLARLAAATGNAADAVPKLRESLALQRRIFGERHPAVAQAMQDLGEAVADQGEKTALVESALQMRRQLFSGPQLGVAESLNTLGVIRYDAGDPKGARGYFEEALRILTEVVPEGHPGRLSVMGNLVAIWQQEGGYEEAERLGRTLLDERRRIVGDNSIDVAFSWAGLGATLTSRGKYSEAEEAFRHAHDLFVHLAGPEHAHVANAARNVARIRLLRGDPTTASQWFENAVRVQLQATGRDAAYWYMRGQAALASARSGRTADAIQDLQLTIEQLTPLVPALRATDMHVTLGFVLLDASRPRDAEAHFRDALATRSAQLPDTDPSIAEAGCGLGAALEMQRRGAGLELLRQHWTKYRTWGLADPVQLGRLKGWGLSPG